MKDEKVHMLQRIFGDEIPSGECRESDFVMRIIDKEDKLIDKSLSGNDLTRDELGAKYDKEVVKFLFTEDLREVTYKECFKAALSDKKDTMTNKRMK